MDYCLLMTSWDTCTYLSSLQPRRGVASLNVFWGFEVRIAWAQYHYFAVTYRATTSISYLEFRYLWNTAVGDSSWESNSSLWDDTMLYFPYGQCPMKQTWDQVLRNQDYITDWVFFFNVKRIIPSIDTGLQCFYTQSTRGENRPTALSLVYLQLFLLTLKDASPPILFILQGQMSSLCTNFLTTLGCTNLPTW